MLSGLWVSGTHCLTASAFLQDERRSPSPAICNPRIQSTLSRLKQGFWAKLSGVRWPRVCVNDSTSAPRSAGGVYFGSTLSHLSQGFTEVLLDKARSGKSPTALSGWPSNLARRPKDVNTTATPKTPEASVNQYSTTCWYSHFRTKATRLLEFRGSCFTNSCIDNPLCAEPFDRTLQVLTSCRQPQSKVDPMVP